MNRYMIKLENLHIGYFQTPAMGKQIVYGPLNNDIQTADMIGIIGRNGVEYAAAHSRGIATTPERENFY